MLPENPYNPRLNSTKIHTSTVIGAITDFRPYYDLLTSNVFTFYLGQTQTQIPAKYLESYIFDNKFHDLMIVGRVKYKGQKLGINLVTHDYSGSQDEIRYYIFDILSQIRYKLKLAMYDLSPFKEQMDIIYNNLINNIHSTSMDLSKHEYFQALLEQLDEQANTELEREFMKNADNTTNMVPPTEGLKPLDEPVAKTEEEIALETQVEYDRIENLIFDGASTLRLNRKTISKLPKSKTNKFVLPLEAGKKDDIDKFMHLTKQPFSFLNYNDALFSVNLTTGVQTMWDKEKDESAWNSLAHSFHSALKSVETRIASKKDKITERRKKLSKANNKLDDQVDYLKEQFEHKASKFQHSAYVKFIAIRTTNNINTIREAQSYSKRVEKALKNKRLLANPIAFFDRALTLFLGATGADIITDLETLGYTSRSDAEYGIKYLLFLLKLVEKREDELISPIITITDFETFGVGYEKPDMLKVMAGHMFIHTVTIEKDYKVEAIEPIPPPTRLIQSYSDYLDQGLTINEIQEKYPELFI